LDVGCYQGLFVIEAAMRGQSAIGVDTLENRVREAKIQAKRFHVSESTEFIVGDAENLPFKDGYFDKVLCAETLEHLLNPAKALFELARVSKDLLVITVPTLTPLYYWYQRIRGLTLGRRYHFLDEVVSKTAGRRRFYPHIQLFTTYSISKMIKNYGLTIVKSVAVNPFPFTLPTSGLNKLNKYLWIWKLFKSIDMKLGIIPLISHTGHITAIKVKKRLMQ